MSAHFNPSPSAGTEAGYAERTSSWTQANAAANTTYDITGLTTTFTADGTSAYQVEVFIPGLIVSSGTPDVYAWLLEGATLLQASGRRQVAANVAQGEVTLRRRITPSAGAHTYKVSARTSAGGAGITLYANADPTYPAFIRVTKVT